MKIHAQLFFVMVLVTHMSPIMALQTHSPSYTTAGSTSSTSTETRPSNTSTSHGSLDAATSAAIATCSSSSTKTTAAVTQEELASLLSNIIDTSTWSADITAEKLTIYHLTQKGISCNTWFFETKYLKTLHNPCEQQHTASPLTSQRIYAPHYLAVLPPTTKYPSGRVVASCTGGIIKTFDLKSRSCTQLFTTAHLSLQNRAAKIAVAHQNIFLGLDCFFEMFQELAPDAWHPRATLTLNDTPSKPTKTHTAPPCPTIDALAVLPNGTVVMLLATELQIDNHMLIATDLTTIMKGTVAPCIAHQKILKNYGTTVDGAPFILLSNKKILLTLTETKMLALGEQKDIWDEQELLMVQAPTAKLFELLTEINSSMKGKDCIAVKKFTHHDTVFYKCYYDSKELPSTLLPNKQMAIIWKGKIMTFGLNEKALS